MLVTLFLCFAIKGQDAITEKCTNPTHPSTAADIYRAVAEQGSEHVTSMRWVLLLYPNFTYENTLVQGLMVSKDVPPDWDPASMLRNTTPNQFSICFKKSEITLLLHNITHIILEKIRSLELVFPWRFITIQIALPIRLKLYIYGSLLKSALSSSDHKIPLWESALDKRASLGSTGDYS